MMINKRLIGTVSESKKYIVGNVLCQWASLAANIAMMGTIARMLQSLYEENAENIGLTAVIAVIAVLIRYVCAVMSSRMGYLSSKAVKKTLREMIYQKLLRLGTSYKEQANTSEVVQVAVEGVDQLETYFGAYLPQFFYAMLAPLTLFGVLSFISFPAAIVLLVCVPMIPVTIVMIQRWAKKLLSKYWGQYTALGDRRQGRGRHRGAPGGQGHLPGLGARHHRGGDARSIRRRHEEQVTKGAITWHLQGGHPAKKKHLIVQATNALVDRYISSVFGFNPSIVLKQIGSLPLAGAYLGMENMSFGMFRKERRDRAFIAKYTQDLQWRAMGYSMPETKQ